MLALIIHRSTNSDYVPECLQSGVDILLDAVNLAEPSFDPGSSAGARRRSWEPETTSPQNVPHAFDDFLSADRVFDGFDTTVNPVPEPHNVSDYGSLVRRAKGTQPACIWQMTVC